MHSDATTHELRNLDLTRVSTNYDDDHASWLSTVACLVPGIRHLTVLAAPGALHPGDRIEDRGVTVYVAGPGARWAADRAEAEGVTGMETWSLVGVRR